MHFIVGADITRLNRCLRPRNNISGICRLLTVMMSAIEDFASPTVVAINGYALGGGLEVCLAWMLKASSSARIGLPETGLGILPGWGGTVRLPRLSDFATAVEWITSARQYSPNKAQQSGIVDRVVDVDQLRAEALNCLSDMASGKIDYCLTRKRKLSPIEQPETEIEAIANMAKAVVQQKTAGHYPAPIRAIELMRQSASLSRDKAIEKKQGVL